MYCDCEHPEVGGFPSIVKARKQYKCCECGITIAPNEKYERTDGIWEGEARSYKTCLSCSEVRERVSNLSDCCIAFSELTEFISVSEDLFDGNDNEAIGRYCSINCLVSWLRRGFNGRFELAKSLEEQ